MKIHLMMVLNWPPLLLCNSVTIPGIFKRLKCFQKFPFVIINILVLFLSYLSKSKTRKYKIIDTHTKLATESLWTYCTHKFSFPLAMCIVPVKVKNYMYLSHGKKCTPEVIFLLNSPPSPNPHSPTPPSI